MFRRWAFDRIPSGHVFHYKGEAIKRITTAWRAAVTRAELPHIRFHDLRHTFATRLAQNGEPVANIKELMGHKRLETTDRYMHANQEQMRAAIERLSQG